MHRRVLLLPVVECQQQIVLACVVGAGAEDQGLLGSGVQKHLGTAAIAVGLQIERLPLAHLGDGGGGCRLGGVDQMGESRDIAGLHQRRPIHRRCALQQRRSQIDVGPQVGAHHSIGRVHLLHQRSAALEGRGIHVVTDNLARTGVEARQIKAAVAGIDRVGWIKADPRCIPAEQW